MTKDQQIYGVFHEEENSGPSQFTDRYAASGKSRRKDYTSPVGFVKGGVQGGSKSKSNKEESRPKLVSFSDR